MATIVSRGKPIKRKFARVTTSSAKLNKRQARQVKQLITRRQEKKFIDYAVNTSIDAGGSVSSMVAPPLGDEDDERIGDEIYMKNLQLKLAIHAADTTNVVRFILVRWLLNSATAVPAVTDILQYANYMSPYNWDTRKQGKVQIIYDRIIPLTYTGTANVVINTNLYGNKLGPAKLYMNDTATTGTRQFFWFAITDSVAANHPTLYGYMRLTYTDS